MNFIRTSTKRAKYYNVNQNTKDWERWNSIPIFPIETTTLWFVLLLILVITTNSNKLLLFYFMFSEYFNLLFNRSLWIWYSFLGTHYYFWQRSALVVKNRQFGFNYECVEEKILMSIFVLSFPSKSKFHFSYLQFISILLCLSFCTLKF